MTANRLNTDTARSFALDFDADALTQIANAATKRAAWLTESAKFLHQTQGLAAARPYLVDADAFAMLARFAAQIATEAAA